MFPDGARDRVIETRGERMAVLEWGEPKGRSIVFVHGNPTWAFLWRRVIAELRTTAPELHLVAPDLIGLGRSSKPRSGAHTLVHHGEWLGDAIDACAPGPIVLVAQDWGGAIGLSAMAHARRDRLRGIVLGNTAVGPPAAGFKPTLFHRTSHWPIASTLLFEYLGFPLGVMHMTQGDRSSIRGEVARAYRWPLAHRSDRAAPLALARMVPDSHDNHVSVPELRNTDELFRTAQVPISLVWGMKDPILGRVVNHLARLRPDATVTKTGAGHFLQEEVPGELAAAVRDVAARADWS